MRVKYHKFQKWTYKRTGAHTDKITNFENCASVVRVYVSACMSVY